MLWSNLNRRRLATLLFVGVSLFAQRTMTVAQVTGFVKSSVQARLDDRSVADVLKKTKLTEKLELPVIAELQAAGAGPRTMAALHELVDASSSLPAPAAVPEKPARVVVTTAPDSVTQAAILDKIREYANTYTQTLPNFICTQVTRRQIDQTGTGEHYQSIDKIQEQLTYFDHHESYKVVMVNGQMVQNKDHEKLGGAVTSGEFGSMMAEIFAPETEAEFDYDHL